MGRRSPRGAGGKSLKTKRRDEAIASAIEGWFRANARVLPWRVEVNRDGWRRDPYRALVSEAMLQQTQVSRVIEKYEAFVARFPTFETLAAAGEQDVLEMWAGLGYYRRARHLHAAAKHVVTALGGEMPREVVDLRGLPGVGAYTAGAIASMAGGAREALVDGNVVRVLLRIEGREGRAGSKDAMEWTWGRARELVEAADEAGVFNEGLMELGAVVCVPGEPRCEACPVRGTCVAFKEGKQREIPLPKEAARRKVVCCDALVIVDARGRVLMEQRGEEGMWSKMWQAPTIERAATHATKRMIADHAASLCGTIVASAPRRVGSFEHTTSHRALSFRVWRVDAEGVLVETGSTRTMTLEAARRAPISNAQKRVLEIGFGA